MDWVIESWIKGDAQGKSIGRKRYKESKKLYLCTTCKNVWNTNNSNTVIRYQSFPTIGLDRVECRYCTKQKEKNAD